MGQLFACIGTRRGKQAIAHHHAVGISHDERLRYQIRDADRNVGSCDAVIGHNFGCRLHREAAGEDRKTTQYRSFDIDK
jgi:hypothetical protein